MSCGCAVPLSRKSPPACISVEGTASQERGRFGHPIDIEIKFQKYSEAPFVESLRPDMKSVSQY